MLRSFLLFLHVASAMGIFVALGIEGAVVARLASEPDSARAALSSYGSVQRVGAASVIGVLLTGIYLATAYWHWQGPWIGTGFLLLIAIAVIGATTSGRRVRAALRAPTDLAAPERVATLRDSLASSLALRASLLAGVVFLMTVKPPAPGMALGVAAAAALIGVAIALLRRRGSSTPNERRARA